MWGYDLDKWRNQERISRRDSACRHSQVGTFWDCHGTCVIVHNILKRPIDNRL